MIAQTLLDWFEREGRDLPWRQTTDPYAILVSEVMLQQTQVRRVLVFFDTWMKRFPDWGSLASASNADVVRAWSGLGYNRRALALRDIARTIVKDGIPQTEEEWLALKGIGPYTAAALTVFSLGKASTPVDTNIRRVIARLQFGIPYPDPKDDAKIKESLMRDFMSHEKFHDIPQALFDLANAYCTKTPACELCPMRQYCASAPDFLLGKIATPKTMVKKSHEKKHTAKPHPDRIFRGRILKVVSENPGISRKKIGKRVDPSYHSANDEVWIFAMISRLEKDGFLTQKNGNLFLSE